MLNTFRYVALSLIRDKGIVIWALVFPIVLSTCFMFMFAGLDEMGQLEPIRVVVVDDENYQAAPAFKAFMGATSEADSSKEQAAGDDNQVIFKTTLAKSADEAEELMRASNGNESPIMGYVTTNAEGLPEVHVRSISSDSGMSAANAALLTMAMDTFVSQSALANDMLQRNPTLFTDPAFVESLFQIDDLTDRISVTQNAPKESVRYFFALLGMAALFGAQSGVETTLRLLPNLGPLGARREVSALSHVRALTGSLLASWAVSFACLAITYAYMRFVAGIDFAGRDIPCLIAAAVSSLMATSLGAFLGSLPKLPSSAKSGILTAFVCFCALFAGLYGQPTMQLADTVDATMPIASLLNPAKQISEAFYSLMYYDSFAPLLMHLGVLLAMALALFALSALSLRRQRYASL